MTDPTQLTAGAIVAETGRGALSCRDVVEAHLARIEARDPDVMAWAHVDRDLALVQADALDAHRQAGKPIGPLHGVPVGIKDIIDTGAMPTENGCALDAGRRPRADAVVVERLRAAGAVIMGKTVTTELATYHPSKTRNPHDLAHTPGGSSSGSAAAVADRMVPAALGTQTNGSVIRPSAFCGIVGFKPSFGLVPRTGVLAQSHSLDTIGAMARDVVDAALIVDAIAGADRGDDTTTPAAAPRLAEMAMSDPPVRPALALVRTPVWERADQETGEALDELAAALGDVDSFDLPDPFSHALEWLRVVMFSELAKNYGRYVQRGGDQLSATVAGMVEEGRSILAHDYLVAKDWQQVLGNACEQIFERCDAIITPAAPGAAPRDLTTTGDPAFCSIWQFCGLPAVTLPLFTAGSGLPMGVQIVGRRGYDGRLLRTARWIVSQLGPEDGE